MKKTIATKRDKLTAIVAISLCFIMVTTFGLIAIFRQKVEQNFVKISQRQVVDAINKSLVESIKETVLDNMMQPPMMQKDFFDKEEQGLVDFYKSDNFFAKLDSIVDDNNLENILNVMFEGVEKYLLSSCTKQCLQDVVIKIKGIQRDFFVGLQKQAYECIGLWNIIYPTIANIASTVSDIATIASAIWRAVMASSYATVATAAINTVLSVLKKVLLAIPVLGWIAIGLIAGVELAIFITMLVKGSQNKGFRVGVVVKTGWFNIPTGLRWVCE